MGVKSLKKWEDIFGTPNGIFNQYFDYSSHSLADYIKNVLLPDENTNIGDETINNVFEYMANYIYDKIYYKRTYFISEIMYYNSLQGYTVANIHKIKYYLEIMETEIRNYKEEIEKLNRTRDPLTNIEKMEKRGDVTVTGNDTLKRAFESTSPQEYISDSPKTIGENTNTQENNLTDTKTFKEDTKEDNNRKTYDPYAYVHVNDFVSKLASPLLTLYMDFMKEWTSPIIR